MPKNVLSFAPWRTLVTLGPSPGVVETVVETAGFVIDEQAMIDWLRWLDGEEAVGRLEGNISVIGRGLEPAFARTQFTRLLGRTAAESVPLYLCPCGGLGCGGLFVDVRPRGDSVLWENLRVGDSPSNLPSFEFDRGQYRQALNGVRSWLP